MKEQLKIIVDDKNQTYIYIDGIKVKYVTKIKFETSEDTMHIPKIEIEKDFLSIQKYGLTKPKIGINEKEIGKFSGL